MNFVRLKERREKNLACRKHGLFSLVFVTYLASYELCRYRVLYLLKICLIRRQPCFYANVVTGIKVHRYFKLIGTDVSAVPLSLCTLTRAGLYFKPSLRAIGKISACETENSDKWHLPHFRSLADRVHRTFGKYVFSNSNCFFFRRKFPQ